MACCKFYSIRASVAVDYTTCVCLPSISSRLGIAWPSQLGDLRAQGAAPRYAGCMKSCLLLLAVQLCIWAQLFIWTRCALCSTKRHFCLATLLCRVAASGCLCEILFRVCRSQCRKQKRTLELLAASDFAEIVGLSSTRILTTCPRHCRLPVRRYIFKPRSSKS